MTGGGRPLRFLAIVLGGWIGMRIWLLWPEPPVALPAPIRDIWPGAVARRGEMPPTRVASNGNVTARAISRREWRTLAVPTPATIVLPPVVRGTADPKGRGDDGDTIALLGMVRYGAPEPAAPGPRRWSASGWSILRGAGRGGGVATPQLGGSQAGLRLSRTLDARGRFAIAARVAAAVDTRQQEAALGIEWTPTRLPVRVIAERRFGLANMAGGTALGVAGGLSDRPLPAGFRLDGYAQAGTILRDRVEGYADGAIRIVRPVFRTRAGVTLDLGVGAWGAAQRGAGRLDIGPAAALTLPVGDATHLRIALEWRQRALGDARPASGPALSIGADY